MLAAVAEGLGRILATLEKPGLVNQTVVRVIGDNGYFYGEHGLSQERRLGYEESIRLPLLVRYPPLVKAGVTPAGTALTTDLAPTDLGTRRCTVVAWHRRMLAATAVYAQAGGLAELVPDRVSDRHRVSADVEDGPRRGAHRAL